ESNGYDTFFVKGIYASKNKKKAYLQPLGELLLTLKFQRNGQLKNISKIEFASQSFDISEDIRGHSMVFFIADFLNQILRNEQKNDVIFDEILKLKQEIQNNNFQSHLVFLFEILRIQGILPLVNEQIFLDPESGNFTDVLAHHFFTEEISTLWRRLSEAVQPYETNISPSQRRDFLDSLLVYYHYHFPDFKTPQSLEILQHIF
ncbi:MAG: DNA repair protein RecO, partial [Bergeyella zoohelcum]|nr:DNA repair protein RecO [Bergeyella zoohelcum]